MFREGGHQSKKLCRRRFTDRDRGEGFVLSAATGPSGTRIRKDIKTNAINTAGDRPVKGHLLGMGEQVCQYLQTGRQSKRICRFLALFFLFLLTGVRVRLGSGRLPGVCAGRAVAFSIQPQYVSARIRAGLSGLRRYTLGCRVEDVAAVLAAGHCFDRVFQ